MFHVEHFKLTDRALGAGDMDRNLNTLEFGRIINHSADPFERSWDQFHDHKGFVRNRKRCFKSLWPRGDESEPRIVAWVAHCDDNFMA